MSLSRALTALIRTKSVMDDDLVAASRFVLDTLACAVGAVHTEPAAILGKVCPPHPADPARTAFYLGGLSHILERDDLHRGSVTHPGCVVIPAAYAIAAQRELYGHAFLKAVLAGYEAMTRIGNAVGQEHYRIWHNTATCGPFGSAMAVAHLLGLDEDQTVWALGNAGTQACGVWEFLASGAMSKHLHTARAAEAGLLAAMLAREGFTGPDTILEGPKGFFAATCKDPSPSAVIADPKGPWQLTQTSIKPWPCCRHTHPAIDAAIAIAGTIPDRSLIDTIVVKTYRAALDVCDRPQPRDPYSAKFSLQHCVAMALGDGCIDAASFDATARERARDLCARVTLMIAPAMQDSYPARWGAEIAVTLRDGRTLHAVRHEAKGDPANPVHDDELQAKAVALFDEAGLDAGTARAFIDHTAALIEDKPVGGLDVLHLLETARRSRSSGS